MYPLLVLSVLRDWLEIKREGFGAGSISVSLGSSLRPERPLWALSSKPC